MLHVLHKQVNVSAVLLQAHHFNDEGVLELTQKAQFIPQVLLLLSFEHFLL